MSNSESNSPIWFESLLINIYDICIENFLILRLRLQSTAEGRSLSGPNIWLRPKVKNVATVQHCKNSKRHLADWNAICILHLSDCAWLCCLLSKMRYSAIYIVGPIAVEKFPHKLESFRQACSMF